MNRSSPLYFNPGMETASVDEIRSIQNKRLQDLCAYVYASNQLYRHLFDAKGLKPVDIKGLDDLQSLPMINKDIMRETYPLGLCCVSRNELREMHMSSGSTGTPVVMPYTEQDLDQWAECMARCLFMSGLHAGDTIQIVDTAGEQVWPVAPATTPHTLAGLEDMTLTASATASVASPITDGDDLYLELNVPGASFISSGTIPGDYLEMPKSLYAGTTTAWNDKYTWVINSIESEERIRIVNNGMDTSGTPNELPHLYDRVTGAAITQGSLFFRVMRDMDIVFAYKELLYLDN